MALDEEVFDVGNLSLVWLQGPSWGIKGVIRGGKGNTSKEQAFSTLMDL